MSPRVPPPQPRPKTIKLSFKSLLLLPFRICNPPPAVGKVRSCSVTPIFHVRLEDILDRKHLPPLGLKDFEEWLLYVELSPENLYFILWLREYTLRYRQWAQRSIRDGRSPPSTSPQLAMFYARAKQTFFTPNSNYELDLPSDMLAPFHISNSSPHPDPCVFDQVAVETQKMLKLSLQRFVSAQFNNVGNNRVICGLIGGTVFCLIGALLPIIYNFATGHSRWARLSAIPGLWLGLSVLFASLHGVCLGVYIFGDLRQLRKFELTRPPISRPQPHRGQHHQPVISSPITGLPVSSGPFPMNNSDDHLPHRPPPIHTRMGRPTSGQSMPDSTPYSPYSPPYLSPSSPSFSPSSSSSSLSYSATDGAAIHISHAYYDPEPIEGPAISPVTSDTGLFAFPIVKNINQNMKQRSEFDDDDDDGDGEEGVVGKGVRGRFGATATFIHPFDADSMVDDEYEYNNPNMPPVEERQRISAFDFDALPALPPRNSHRPQPLQLQQPQQPRQSQPRQSQPRQSQPRQSQPHQSSTVPQLQQPRPPHPPYAPRRNPPTSSLSLQSGPSPSMLVIQPEAELLEKDLSPKGLIRRIQSRCNINRWLVLTSSSSTTDLHEGDPESGEEKAGEGGEGEEKAEYEQSNFPRPHPHSHQTHQNHQQHTERGTGTGQRQQQRGSDVKLKRQFKMVKAVPAFASPLTRILSPVVIRGQWEIVVRSMVIACVVSWVAIGVLLALPVPGR
ncbi:hypothetical protein BDP27DRAFT_1357077 [Rhodocollybia butyracea]|uniref:RGS domain-containing protein n=1 Tax=Rhodocollybia butyracea TaxID=206335 RepID=A0A9P5UGM7_9AGAR|nr:hypothetical protein BDP27DRAFT_1357077 [Rhodocollybia butyracea]